MTSAKTLMAAAGTAASDQSDGLKSEIKRSHAECEALKNDLAAATAELRQRSDELALAVGERAEALQLCEDARADLAPAIARAEAAEAKLTEGMVATDDGAEMIFGDAENQIILSPEGQSRIVGDPHKALAMVRRQIGRGLPGHAWGQR